MVNAAGRELKNIKLFEAPIMLLSEVWTSVQNT